MRHMSIHFKKWGIVITSYIRDTILSSIFTKNSYYFAQVERLWPISEGSNPIQHLCSHTDQAVAYLPLWIEKEIFMEFSICQSDDDAGCPVSCSTQHRPTQSIGPHSGKPLLSPGSPSLTSATTWGQYYEKQQLFFWDWKQLQHAEKSVSVGTNSWGIGFVSEFLSLISKNGQTWWNDHWTDMWE